MTKKQAREYGEFVAVLIEAAPKSIPVTTIECHSAELSEIAGSVHRLDEAACNGELISRQQKRNDRLEQRARDLAQIVGAEIKFNGDPRGFSIYLKLSTGRYNGWGGPENGWGVPF